MERLFSKKEILGGGGIDERGSDNKREVNAFLVS